MSPIKKSQQIIKVNGGEIRYTSVDGKDYISLTDMSRAYGSERAVESWLRNKNTIEFLGVWEQLYNPDFNSHEFVGIKSEAGLNRFNISVKEWVAATKAKGLEARTGRYGGTYAHKDIALEFATWLSPTFKLLVLKDYERLKALELSSEQWDIKRYLSKAAYKLQTQAIQGVIATDGASMSALQQKLIYASEADILNVMVFGKTAAEWKKANPKLAKGHANQRDYATAKQLLIISHLGSINANMINRKLEKAERIRVLAEEAKRQQNTLDEIALEEQAQRFKELNQRTSVPAEKPLKLTNPKGFEDTLGIIERHKPTDQAA